MDASDETNTTQPPGCFRAPRKSSYEGSCRSLSLLTRRIFGWGKAWRILLRKSCPHSQKRVNRPRKDELTQGRCTKVLFDYYLLLFPSMKEISQYIATRRLYHHNTNVMLPWRMHPTSACQYWWQGLWAIRCLEFLHRWLA